jgi:hypothetical protein
VGTSSDARDGNARDADALAHVTVDVKDSICYFVSTG